MDTVIPKIGQDWSESRLSFTGGYVPIKCVCMCACVSMCTCVYRHRHWEYGIQAAWTSRTLFSCVMSEPILNAQGQTRHRVVGDEAAEW